MRVSKWSVGVRNTLSSIAMEFDSCAAIESTGMTPEEREKCKKSLKKVIDFIDKEHDKARKREKKK